MGLRRPRRIANGAAYEYWTLVQSRRTASGPRQHPVATPGKLPGLDENVHAGRESIDALLEGGAPAKQLELSGPPPSPAPPLWRRRGLHTLLNELIPPGREEVPWERIAGLLTVARFCAQPGELGVAERWYQRTALEDLLGESWDQINDGRLYRGPDELPAHKEELTQHLLARHQSWFGVGLEFLIHDVTSTFFEGQAKSNAKAAARHGARRKRRCRPGRKRGCWNNG